MHNSIVGSVRSIVYQAAEKTIIDASCFVFANAGRLVALEKSSPGGLDYTEVNRDCFSDTVVVNHRGRGLGGPSSSCAVKVLKFFIDILQRSCDEGKSSATGSTTVKRSPSSSTGVGGANGNGMTNGAQNPRHSFGGDTVNGETRELLFAIKAINAIFLAEGELNGSRALISK